MTKRAEKKSETIEVRVSYSEKLAFMEACKQAGTTASHAIRGYIDDFLHPKPELSFREKLARALPVSGALVLTISLVGFVALDMFKAPNGASATTAGFSQTSVRVLNHFDQDGDGYLSSDDLNALEAEHKVPLDWLLAKGDQNKDGQIDVAELDALTNYTIELRAGRGGNQSGSGENIVILPPDLTEEERRAFLKKSGVSEHMGIEEAQRLNKMLDALLPEDIEPVGSDS
jgi:hypothetical protein